MPLVRLFPLVALAGLAACSNLTAPPEPEPIASDTPVTVASASARPPPGTVTAPAGAQGQPPQQPNILPQADLKTEDLVVGKGPEVKNGDTVAVHYVGTLLDGTKFDASRDHGTEPFVTTIPGRVIQGWNRGIPGMRVGGKRRLTVPPQLGYGPRAQGKIPANSTLVFEVELVEIKSGAQTPPPSPHAAP